MKTIKNFSILAIACALALFVACSKDKASLNKNDFANPPAWAGLDTWWHWCGSNITRTGIYMDLHAMHERGIKRATVFDLFGYRFEDIPEVKLASDEWMEMFRYALSVADSLGIQIGLHNCPGWATSGGPWISLEQSMKVTTWSKVTVAGGKAVSMMLPSPKDSLGFYRDVAVLAYPALKGAVARDAVINISSAMDESGLLKWDAPAGEWTILRFGYTTNGECSKPTNPSGAGLECDKLDADIVKYHFDSFLGKVVENTKEYVGKSFKFALIDSWECHMQNWTARFPEFFRDLKGYDITPWLPVIAGDIIDSAEASEKMMSDYYSTIAELTTENYYHNLSNLCHSVGLEFHSEPIYGGWNRKNDASCDILRANSYCDLPMFEFWYHANSRTLVPDYNRYNAGCKPVSGFPLEASIFTGNGLVGSEAYTGYANFTEIPQTLKPFGDEAFCGGINQLILHSYVMQPYEGFPIVALKEKFGGHYNRNNPWYNLSDGWFEFQKRVQYVLQQGHRVADYLYYVGDQYPQAVNYGFRGGRAPVGYRENAVSINYLEKAMDYGVLAIPKEAVVGKETEAKIDSMKALGLKVWYEKDGGEIPLGLPDFTSGLERESFLYTHRVVGNKDVYYVFNQNLTAQKLDFTFRVKGKVPEIWDPETGKVFSPERYSYTDDGRTSVKIAFEPHQTFFVVFSKATIADSVPELERSAPIALTATIDFDPVYDEEIPSIATDTLVSLSESSDERIRHFGGYINYTIKFDLPEKIHTWKPLALAFESLSATAKVTLNGEPLGFLWHDGQQLDAPGLKRTGNVLEVRVATSLRNRMIGDMVQFGKPVHVPTMVRDEYIPSEESMILPFGLWGEITVREYDNL